MVKNEQAIIDAIVKNDPKGFHADVVPDGFALSGQGSLKVSDFDKVMEQMKADCKVTKWGLSESVFYWINDSASSVWANKAGEWLSAFHHESELATPSVATKK